MEIGLIALCYLLGSVPVAWIVTRAVTGKDLRALGSGNVGVMNTALSVARWAGLLVLLGEATKGVLAVLLARQWGVNDLVTGLAIVATVAGTRWSVWMRGAGGRGNTTGVAGLLLLVWPSVAISLAMWILMRLLTRSSFWATRVWILSLPVSLGLVTGSWECVGWGSGLSPIYLSTHDTQTDDHNMIKEKWPNLWAFLTGPRRTSF
jgi:glycerol-3-phosphate acyltransferase PlsY